MDCFICTFISKILILKEHRDAKWLTKETIDQVAWLPADLDLIAKIKQELL